MRNSIISCSQTSEIDALFVLNLFVFLLTFLFYFVLYDYIFCFNYV